ncbi:hypothetical protein DSO57_1029249 [Entomophthora muscae]|nr:hypothetical protein DSO57_1029249 [Entomophthora muscae]
MPLNSLPSTTFPQFKEDGAWPAAQAMQNYAAFQLQTYPAYTQCYTPEIPMYSQSHSPPSFSDVNLAYVTPKSEDLYYSMPYSNVSVNPLNSNLAFHPGSFISPYAPP